MDIGKKFLTVEQLSKEIQIPAFTVRQMARDGRLPAFKPGKRYLFDFDEVIETLKRKYRVKA